MIPTALVSKLWSRASPKGFFFHFQLPEKAVGRPAGHQIQASNSCSLYNKHSQVMKSQGCIQKLCLVIRTHHAWSEVSHSMTQGKNLFLVRNDLTHPSNTSSKHPGEQNKVVVTGCCQMFKTILLMYIKHLSSRSWRDTSVVKGTCSYQGAGFHYQRTYQLTTICNSSPLGSDIIFWSLLTLHTCGAETPVQAKHPHSFYFF